MSENQPSRPGKVKTAMALLYIALVISLLRYIMFALGLKKHAIDPVFIVIFFIFAFTILCIMWVLIHMIGKGRNWARTIYIAAIVLGFLPICSPEHYVPNHISSILGIISFILLIIAVVFLFQQSSSDWFKQMESK